MFGRTMTHGRDIARCEPDRRALQMSVKQVIGLFVHNQIGAARVQDADQANQRDEREDESIL